MVTRRHFKVHAAMLGWAAWAMTVSALPRRAEFHRAHADLRRDQDAT